MEDFIDVTSDVTSYLSVFISILYLRGFVRNNKAFKFFTLYLVFVAIIQLAMIFIKFVYPGQSNLFLFVYYFVFQFILLSLFYWTLLKSKYILYIAYFIICFLLYQYIKEPSLYFKYNPIGITITQSALVMYALVYLYKNLSTKSKFQIVNSGLFIYLIVSILIFASGNLVLNNTIPRSFSQLLVDLNVFVYFFFQIIILIEWWRNYRVKASKN